MNTVFSALSLFLVSVSFATAVTVGTIERPPFMLHTDNDALSGFSVELWDEAAARAGIDYQWREFTVFGDMIDAVHRGTVDAAIANITITSERETYFDFSQPIYKSGLAILTPVENGALSFAKIIWESGIVWFIIGAVGILLVIAHIVWFFERGVADKRHDYFRDDYFGGVWDAFWWAFIIMTMGGFENEVPHKRVSRAIAIFWIVCSLFFISTLTAKITTSLTISELSSNIENVDDLRGKRVGSMDSQPINDYLAGFNITPHTFTEQEALYAALAHGDLDAVVGDAPILQYYAQHAGQGRVRIAGSVFKPENYGAAFPENSLLKERFDRALIEMQEDGTYQTLYEKYFGE